MLVALLVFVLVAGVIVGGYVVVPRIPGMLARRRLERRLQEVGPAEEASEESIVNRQVKGPLPVVDRLIGRTGAGSRLARLIEQAGVSTTPSAIVVTSALRGEGKTVTAEQAYSHWTNNPGLADPLFDGVIVDEFIGPLNVKNVPKYAAWAEAVRRIGENKRYAGKLFYPYCIPLYHGEVARAFIQTSMDFGYPFALERYLKEQPSASAAWNHLDERLRVPIVEWRAVQPECVKHMIVCLGYMSAPPESLSTNPSVNYKVYMDMQFNLLANHPVFWGLYGVMEYLSSYADEENVRWAGRLFRHYCIEGNSRMLTADPYRLPHLVNPDFDEGTTGWSLSEAESGSIVADEMKGYGFLEGRYPRTPEGDRFIVLKQSDKRPNQISQDIKKLQPGRVYSLKMYTGDRRDLSVRTKHAVSIRIENAEVLTDRAIDHVFANSYSHHVEPYDRQHKAWMNYHVRLFRATGTTARLFVSDWNHGAEAGKTTGQELMINFIEVQPYFERGP